MNSSNQVMMDENPWPDVRYYDQGNKIILDNCILQVTLSKPGGIVTCIRYGGLDNLLEIHNKEINRGYWDLNWSEPDGKDNFDVPTGTEFQIIHADRDKIEVSFVRPYDPNHHWPMVPLNIDKRFVLLRGHSGFYSYGIYERPYGFPDFNLNQTRITFKLRKDRFHYMAIADNKLRLMPSPDDLCHDRCQELAYPEAVLLTKPVNIVLQGEVDDKYQYSCSNRENRVHGWISTDPSIGFWIITPSYEFRNGGPTKQNLTCHVGPTCLAMFHSAHYAGIDLCPQFKNQEPWQKVFGPVFIYLNSAPVGAEPRHLWDDAQRQMTKEVSAWPYSWPSSPDFAKAEERGQISGRLLVLDRYAMPNLHSGTYAFLGLAAPGEKGSWQRESKGYQFWAQADCYGYFSIKNVRAGVYDLYGWVPGILGDYKREGSIHISPGDIIPLDDLVYTPPRDGPTIWEIGIPDRTATKFYVPDPNPKYINRLYVNHPEKYRHYGLWARYSEIYPSEDLVFTVGRSDYRRDWFFAHLCRIEADGSYQPATWQIRFFLPLHEQYRGIFKLRMAIAASNNAAIQVRVNDPSSPKPLFDTMQFGKDNAIARHGIHGLYTLFNIDIPASLMRRGDNTIYLTQRKASGPFTGVMYDYLRLEAPTPEFSPVTHSFS
ncbi:rhamnogalacturonan endolyase [Marchantia polymorpha subsp. ruderalis]